MTLREYLDKNELTNPDFARAHGFTTEAVRVWAAGLSFPGKEHRRRLLEATDGEVTSVDLLAACDAA